jgi:hypothetical protein
MLFIWKYRIEGPCSAPYAHHRLGWIEIVLFIGLYLDAIKNSCNKTTLHYWELNQGTSFDKPVSRNKLESDYYYHICIRTKYNLAGTLVGKGK